MSEEIVSVEEDEVPINISGDIIPVKKFRAFKRFCKNRPALVSLIFIIFCILICAFPSFISGYSQNHQELTQNFRTPSGEHFMGTDALGRDLFTELLYAMQITLRIASGVALVSTLIGAFVGSIAAYAGGWIDSLLMRLTDLALVVPAIIILAIGLKKYGTAGDIPLILIISLTMWMYTARLVRSQVLSLKTREYVDAAKVSGRGFFYIITRHLIRNAISVIAVSAAITISAAITLESTVSFLGFGVKPPRTSLGLMLYAAKGNTTGDKAYLFYAPGMAIFLIVLAVNFISDGLRDAFDPGSEKT